MSSKPVVDLRASAGPQVSSIGCIGGDKNISITQQLSAVVEKHLGIPPARVYVNVRLACASCMYVHVRLTYASDVES